MSNFEKELIALLNKHNQENASDIPDDTLAAYLIDCLAAYNKAVQQRESWHGRILGLIEP